MRHGIYTRYAKVTRQFQPIIQLLQIARFAGKNADALSGLQRIVQGLAQRVINTCYPVQDHQVVLLPVLGRSCGLCLVQSEAIVSTEGRLYVGIRLALI